MSPARFQILQALSDGQALSMVELADRLSVTKRNITTLVDGMEKSELVVRKPHPTDRRSTLVSLTKVGIVAFNEAAEAHSEQMDALVAELNTAQAAAISQALVQLTQRLAPKLTAHVD